jgi:hypothetical protein
MVKLSIWENEAAIDDLLAHHGLAPACGFDDPERRNDAWREFIARLIAADAKQHYDR